MITYKTLFNKISDGNNIVYDNALDRWYQSRKMHDCEASRTHSGGLQHPIYDPHTGWY
jgi:hypothetical protein